MKRLDCLCVGIVVADHVCSPIEHLPVAGELITTDRLQLTVGGCAANVAVDLARLDVATAIVGRVGDDVFGRFVRGSLESAGVRCDQLTVSNTAQTSGTLVVNVKGEDRRFIHNPGANAEFHGTELSADVIRNARVLYLGGYCLSALPTAETVADMFRIARDAGVTTVLDVVISGPGNYWDRLRPVLPYTDVFLPNGDEAGKITGLSDPRAQARAFCDAGAKTVVITCGDDGACCISGDQQLRAKTFPVEFVDGTGSGDAFVAGYIYGLLQDQSPADCMRLGSALGGSCVRATGATTGVFTAAELSEFLQQNALEIESL